MRHLTAIDKKTYGFYMLVGLILLYRIFILCKYSFHYVDDDQALMWVGTVEFSHFRFHEPCFFGQAYGSMIESLIAVPLYQLGVPLNMALPIATVALSVIPFILLGGVWRKRRNILRHMR